MSSSFLRLNLADLGKSLVVFVLAAVFAELAAAMNVGNFDFFTYDWQSLLSVAGTAAMAYLAKNLFTNEEGKLGHG